MSLVKLHITWQFYELFHHYKGAPTSYHFIVSLPHPCPLATADLFSISIALFCWGCYISGVVIVCYLVKLFLFIKCNSLKIHPSFSPFIYNLTLFYWWNGIASCKYTRLYFSTPLVKETWVVSTFWQLEIGQLWTFLYNFSCESKFSFFFWINAPKYNCRVE